MSTPHDAPSPSRPPRRQPNTSGRAPPKRNRQNRATLPKGPDAPPNLTVDASDLAVADSDSAAVSGEEIQFKGRRNVRKHNQSQSMSAGRRISPPNVPTASLTDTERGPNKPTTPAKATPAKATPVKSVAYAGPSFHSSPAPSSLPRPKFLSKSVPAKVPAPLEEGSDSASPPSPSPPSPSRNSIALPYNPGESGPGALDFLFKADREEKAKISNGGPRNVAFANAGQSAPFGAPLQHPHHDSSTSLHGMFPIEMDGEASNEYNPTSQAQPGYRSITAPSRIPQRGPESQAENVAFRDHSPPTNEDAEALQALLSRLSQQQQQGQGQPAHMTPPRVVDHMPSEPSSRHHTPSPFYNPQSSHRSASGPTTPVNAMQQGSGDHVYGNRNLSPMFQAFQSEGKRNSGLRTEISPDSPTGVSKLDFQSVPQAPRPNANSNPFHNGIPSPARNGNNNSPGHGTRSFNPPTGPKQSPGPRPPYNGTHQHNSPNAVRSSVRCRPYNPHPRGYQNPRFKESTAVTLPKPKPPTVNPFIPASVQAKQYAKPKPAGTEKEKSPSPPPAASDTAALEQQLRGMLNLNQKPKDG